MRLFLTAVLASACIPVAYAQRAPMNPVDVIGVESCEECHEEMVDSWRTTAHSLSFETLISSPAASEMAETLGISAGEIAMKASCVRCHYTQEYIGALPQPTAGVSCESCHGEGFNWIDEHYKKSISRVQRVERSARLGMIHPTNLHEMTGTCYECHVIDDEQLVNLAGHPAMSDDFEILSWYSGEVAHNFLVQESGKATKTHTQSLQSIPQSRKRLYYLIGKLQHVSFTLRALARAKDPPVDRKGEYIVLPDGNYTFAVQHAVQLRELEIDLKEVSKRVSIPQFTKTLALLRGLSMTTGHNREMETAALQVSRLAERLAKSYSGQEFAAIDPILEKLHPRYSEKFGVMIEASEVEQVVKIVSEAEEDIQTQSEN